MFQSELSNLSYGNSFIEEQEDGGRVIVTRLRSCHGDSFAAFEAESETAQPRDYHYYNRKSNNPNDDTYVDPHKKEGASPPAETAQPSYSNSKLPLPQGPVKPLTVEEERTVTRAPPVAREYTHQPHMVSTPRHGGRTPLTTATPKETTAAVPERRRRSSPSLFRVQTGSYNTPSAIPRLTDQSHALTYVAEDVSHSPPLDIPPLILIQRRGGRNREQDASMHVPLTELEEQAYENQLRHLQSELQEANDAIEALRAQFATEVERVAEERVQAYRNDERQRRQQFQEALHKLQEENRELTSALTAQSEEQLIGRAFTEKGELPPVVQAEWSRRLREVEDYWKEHVRLVEERWEATQHSQSQGKQELLAQIRELTYAATQLEELNRHLQREKGELELELCHVRVLPAREEEEKVAPPPPPSQLEALQLELETSIREMEKRELQHAQQIGRLKDELHRERARGAQLVELYSGQIQTLHEQLQHATQGRH